MNEDELFFFSLIDIQFIIILIFCQFFLNVFHLLEIISTSRLTCDKNRFVYIFTKGIEYL